jgi:hypothetical protein
MPRGDTAQIVAGEVVNKDEKMLIKVRSEVLTEEITDAGKNQGYRARNGRDRGRERERVAKRMGH